MLILVVISELCDTNGFTIFLYISGSWSDFYKYIVFYNKLKLWCYFHFKNKSLGKVIFMNHSPKKMTTLYKYALVYLKFQQLKLKKKKKIRVHVLLKVVQRQMQRWLQARLCEVLWKVLLCLLKSMWVI